MPGMVQPVGDERGALVSYLEQQRYTMRLTAFGLRDEQARLAVQPSGLSVGGLVKHVAHMERMWAAVVDGTVAESEDDYEANFRMDADETLAAVLERYDAAARHTNDVVSRRDLADAVPVPKDVPWFPDDVDAWSVRWVLLHLIEETARHNGHADMVRQVVDGATAFPLMAAAEGWPATPWMQPWQPPA